MLPCHFCCLAPCSHGWWYYDGSCYALVTEPVAWSTATKNCEYMNSVLVEVGSLAENTFLHSLAKWTGLNVWIAYHYVDAVGGFQWQSSQQNRSFNHWENHIIAQSGYCAALRSSADGQWTTILCDSLRQYICKSGGLTSIMLFIFYDALYRSRLSHHVVLCREEK